MSLALAGDHAKRSTFRHGAVHGDAIAAALSLLQGGVEKVTMRAVAAALGVTHRSLYNHFDDRAALMEALAAEGFDALAVQLEDAKEPRGFARAFATFALAQPDLYGVMMGRANARDEASATLKGAIGKVIALSLAVLAPVDGEESKTEKTAARRRVMRIWMTIHGGLALNRAGMLAHRDDDAFLDEMEEILFSDL